MKFSVIMPVYNREHYLKESTESVINQTYQDFELIMVDDGSTDASFSVCEQYRSKYPDKIKVLHQENQGPLRARRNGLSVATGDYVLYLDSDDSFRLDTFEKLNAVIEKSKSDLIMFNYTRTGDFKLASGNYPFNNGEVFEGEDKIKIYRLLNSSNLLNRICLKAIKREIIDDQRDYLEFGRIKMAEDLLEELQPITSAKKIIYIDEVLCSYRKTEESLVAGNFNRDDYLDQKAVADEIKKYNKTWNLDESEYHNSSLVIIFDSVARIFSKDTRSMQEIKKDLVFLSNEEMFTKAMKYRKYYPINGAYQKYISFLVNLLYKKKYGMLLFILKLSRLRKAG